MQTGVQNHSKNIRFPKSGSQETLCFTGFPKAFVHIYCVFAYKMGKRRLGVLEGEWMGGGYIDLIPFESHVRTPYSSSCLGNNRDI